MKNFLSILFIFFGITSYAQTYQYVPIPTSNAEWKALNTVDYQSGHGSPAGYICHSLKYSFSGQDTIIGPDTLHAIRAIYYREPNCKGLPFNSILEGATDAGTTWMTERHKKVYLTKTLPLDTSVVIPYLDFNLSYVGEKVPGGWATDTVVSIDTITINGQLRRRIVRLVDFWKRYPSGAADTIIEGIGGTNFALGFAELFWPGVSASIYSRLYCFSANGQAEYVRDNSPCMDVWPTGVKDFTSDKQLSLNPNPFNHRLVVSLPGGATIRVYNLLGVSVYSGTFSTEQDAVITTSEWRSGLYIATIEHKGARSTHRLVKL